MSRELTEPRLTLTLYSIGHSTHPIERFIELLGGPGIEMLADVRSFPSSRKWPHFNQGNLDRALAAAGIRYSWLKSLGGRRKSTRPDSPHTAWTHPAFRSYADYADSSEFEAGLSELISLAREAKAAYMCSEGLWWKCHRRIISDHLVARGHRVMHILPDGRLAEHSMSDFARLVEGRIVYSGPNLDLHLK